MKAAVGAAGVERVRGDRQPLLVGVRAYRLDLLGRDDGVARSPASMSAASVAGVDRRLRQPHPLGARGRSGGGSRLPPENLRAHDRASLSSGAIGCPHTWAMAPPRPGASVARRRPRADAPHDLRVVAREPARQGGAEVEGQAGVVVDDGGDVVLARRRCARRRWPGSTRRGCARSSRGNGAAVGSRGTSSVQGFSRGG